MPRTRGVRFITNIKDFKIGSLRTADYGNTRREPGSRVTAHAC